MLPGYRRCLGNITVMGGEACQGLNCFHRGDLSHQVWARVRGPRLCPWVTGPLHWEPVHPPPGHLWSRSPLSTSHFLPDLEEMCSQCMGSPGDPLRHPLCLTTCEGAQWLHLCPTLCNPIDCILPGSSVHGDSPGKNIGVVCRFLLEGIFLSQGLNPGLPP